MTRKDYILIAKEFRKAYFKYMNMSPETKNVLTELRVNLALELEKENPHFNHYKFNEACGDGI